MFDLDFAFDLESFGDDFALNSKTKSRIIFDLVKSFKTLEISYTPPKENESLRLISPAGGWSSTSVILWINSFFKIEELIATTLRIGKKEMDALDSIDIPKATFIVAPISTETMRKNGKNYEYSEYIEQIAVKNGWKVNYINNHSKVILIKSKNKKFVIETSSNLNENPKIEQFIITQSVEIYDYYIHVFKKLKMI